MAACPPGRRPYGFWFVERRLKITPLGEAAQLRAIRALQAVYGPEGFNLGVNLGDVAGAGFAGHVHQHVVPRWTGDTNFMPVVGDTVVLPEVLPDSWRKLRDAFEATA